MLDQGQLEQWARIFPFAVGQGARRCEGDCACAGECEPGCDGTCDGVMDTTYVHDRHSQAHWRGVEAWQCQRCERTVRKAPREARSR